MYIWAPYIYIYIHNESWTLLVAILAQVSFSQLLLLKLSNPALTASLNIYTYNFFGLKETSYINNCLTNVYLFRIHLWVDPARENKSVERGAERWGWGREASLRKATTADYTQFSGGHKIGLSNLLAPLFWCQKIAYKVRPNYSSLALCVWNIELCIYRAHFALRITTHILYKNKEIKKEQRSNRSDISEIVLSIWLILN